MQKKQKQQLLITATMQWNNLHFSKILQFLHRDKQRSVHNQPIGTLDLRRFYIQSKHDAINR